MPAHLHCSPFLFLRLILLFSFFSDFPSLAPPSLFGGGGSRSVFTIHVGNVLAQTIREVVKISAVGQYPRSKPGHCRQCLLIAPSSRAAICENCSLYLKQFWESVSPSKLGADERFGAITCVRLSFAACSIRNFKSFHRGRKDLRAVVVVRSRY